MTQREKDMQRMEISRLRNQLVKLAGLTQISNNEAANLPTLDDYFSGNNNANSSNNNNPQGAYVHQSGAGGNATKSSGLDGGGSLDIGEAFSVGSANKQSKSGNRS